MFLHHSSRMRPQHGFMTPDLNFALLGAITVFFWLVAQAWALFVLWAEGRATRAADAGSLNEQDNP